MAHKRARPAKEMIDVGVPDRELFRAAQSLELKAAVDQSPVGADEPTELCFAREIKVSGERIAKEEYAVVRSGEV